MTTREAEEALAKAVGGDHLAFAWLVRKHQAMVFSIANRFLHNGALAEDLAQDVFLQLYQHLHAIKCDTHLTFWLRRTTSHRCIDLVRRQNLRPQVSFDEVPDVADEVPLPDPLLAQLLRSLVTTLPEKPRLIIILRYQEELDPSEIAEILEMPVATVNSHLRRSLIILREKVSRRLGEVNVYE